MYATLLIMAAGLGSRFGGGIKQLESVGPRGEIIMDYSIHDAIEAGFDKVIFVIREDMKEVFRQVIGERIEKECSRLGVKVEYAFQKQDDIPEAYTVPEGRHKPWGTGQAVLAARELIAEPFVVINADDYYGKSAFTQMRRFMDYYDAKKNASVFCLGGFILKNTLSDFGTVTRGICKVDEKMFLTDIKETKKIEKFTKSSTVVVDGREQVLDQVAARTPEGELDPDSYVSMNMWGLTPDFMKTLEEGFVEFFRNTVPADPMTAEYLLPIFIGDLLAEHRVMVKVLETSDHWFGMTYKEDTPIVKASFAKLVADGVYKEDLFSDLG